MLLYLNHLRPSPKGRFFCPPRLGVLFNNQLAIALANAQDLAIISALLDLGRGFNLRIVAEGVETQQQLEILQGLDCEEAQGYLFHHPLNPDQATELLNRHFSVS